MAEKHQASSLGSTFLHHFVIQQENMKLYSRKVIFWVKLKLTQFQSTNFATRIEIEYSSVTGEKQRDAPAQLQPLQKQ